MEGVYVDPVVVSREGLAELGLADAPVREVSELDDELVRFEFEMPGGGRAACVIPIVCLVGLVA